MMRSGAIFLLVVGFAVFGIALEIFPAATNANLFLFWMLVSALGKIEIALGGVSRNRWTALSSLLVLALGVGAMFGPDPPSPPVTEPPWQGAGFAFLAAAWILYDLGACTGLFED